MRWLFVFLLFISPQLHALVVCYDEEASPAVNSIEPFGESVIAVVGGTGWDPQTSTLPRVTFDGYRWQAVDRVTATVHEVREPDFRRCRANIPLPKLTAAEAKGLREWRYEPDEYEQHATACVEVDGVWYFGLGFYDGEGITGVGGLGRYDPTSGVLEIRRPELLRNVSVTAIAHHQGDFLIGTASLGECAGLIPALGMMHYDWQTDRLRPVGGFPGFVIHDLLSHQGSVWVASDLGLSRGQKVEFGYGWDHWTHTGDPEHPMQWETQRDLYTRLLRTLSHEYIPAGDSPYGQFVEHLRALQPKVGVAVMDKVLQQMRDELASCRAAGDGDKAKTSKQPGVD